MKAPENYLYSAQHMWAKHVEGNTWIAGITDYAQDLLGDVVFIDSPKVGSQLVAAQSCGIVESVKTGADLFSPLDGEVVDVNTDLINAPESIQDAPYSAWIFKIKTADGYEPKHLLTAADYQSSLKA